MRKETPYAVVSGISGVVYEICWYMRGLEQWFMDLATDPEFCGALLDRTLRFWLDWFRLFLDEVGDLVDVIMIGDDLAGQTGPLFRPEVYRALVKPRQKRLVQYIRSRTAAKIWYHTCGSCVAVHPRLAGQRRRHPQSGADQREGHGPGGAEGGVRRSAGLLGRGDRLAARAALGLAGDGPRARPPQSRGVEARRRLRVQQRPQHPGRRPAGERRRVVRRGVRVRRLQRQGFSNVDKASARSPSPFGRGLG